MSEIEDGAIPDPLLDALMSADRRVALEAQRLVLAAALARPGLTTTLSMQAAASKELRAIVAEIAALPVARKESVVDQLANARAARGAASTDSAPTGRRSQSRRSNGSHRVG